MEKAENYDFNKDFDFIKGRFDELPEISLPTSLTAENLWARMDAAEQTVEKAKPAETKANPALRFIRQYRPVLSYAAVFVVMVLVYYGAGLDSSPVVQPQMMAENEIVINETAIAPRMAMDSGAENGSSAAAAAAPQAPMMAASPQMTANSAYKGLPGEYSGEAIDFTSFGDKLQLVELSEGEKLSFNISETDNMIFINISTQGEDRLRSEIAKLIEECAIPEERVSISAVTP